MCVWSAHLPGLAAPPAGIGSDVQRPAAGLSGEKGELAHGATDKAAQVGSYRLAGAERRRGNPEEQQQAWPDGEEHVYLKAAAVLLGCCRSVSQSGDAGGCHICIDA